MIADMTRTLVAAALVQVSGGVGAPAPPAEAVLRVVAGTTGAGDATEQWLTMLRKRLSSERYDSVATLRKPWTEEEESWAGLIRSRVAGWERAIPALGSLFPRTPPPGQVLIVLGNRGAEDAFTHDPVTIGFDLSALQANYGSARLAENTARIDRFFRHEFVHLFQKAWLTRHPWATDTPLQETLAEIWGEGLGNYHSLSSKWLSREGKRSETASRALAVLEPRFVARVGALACATPEEARALTADLSNGPFDRKWGALPAALWLEAEPGEPTEALRRFVVAGPDGVWDLADRHLPDGLAAALKEARAADSLCRS
jgi:hypothetical protein